MQNTITQNRLYKDRLFVTIYGKETEQSKKWRLDLYNALNNSHYTDPNSIELTTIDNIIYITMHNDVSFLIDNQMNLYEHQSTYNPNLPLRGMMYFAQLYQMYINKQDKDIFSTTLIKIPEPRFIVFYNGNTDCPDTVKLKLSDAFDQKGTEHKTVEFEWTATMLNINIGHNNELHKKCKSLYDYCKYVDTIKQNLKKMPRQEAIENAVDEAIKQKLLGGFFKDQRMEIMNMSLTEFDQEEYDRHRRAEGREEGIAEGAHDKAIESARNLLALNILTAEQIAQANGLSLEEVLSLQKS